MNKIWTVFLGTAATHYSAPDCVGREDEEVSGIHSMPPVSAPFHSFCTKGHRWCDLFACRDISLPFTVLLQPLVPPGIPVLVLDKWQHIPTTSLQLKCIGLCHTVIIREWMTPQYPPPHKHYLQPPQHPLMVITATWTGCTQWKNCPS